MSPRAVAALAAFAGIALVVAQYFVPSWAGFHTWQYATALALAATFLLGYVRNARKTDGETGSRLAIAAFGAFAIVATGMASGLLGPDTETVVRAPGTVAPLPDVHAAAFFPVAGPDQIARGDAHVLLRRLNQPEMDLAPGSRQFAGATALELVPKTAAYVEVRDLQGRHLTITQPTNPSFLSPVLLFPQKVTVAGKLLAADAFAAPAEHRQIKAFFFPNGSMHDSMAHGVDGDAVLFAVDGDDGKLLTGGISIVGSGKEATLGGVRLQPTIGTYPALAISAIPYPPAIWIGVALLLGGIGYAAAGSRPLPAVRPGADDEERTAPQSGALSET